MDEVRVNKIKLVEILEAEVAVPVVVEVVAVAVVAMTKIHRIAFQFDQALRSRLSGVRVTGDSEHTTLTLVTAP